MSTKHNYGEYITLREAMALAGPKLVLGWRGNELDHGIWRLSESRHTKDDLAKGVAQHKYMRLASWFSGAVRGGQIGLIYFDASGTAVGVKPARIERKDSAPVWFSGRLTEVTVEEQLAGAQIDEGDPELFVDCAAVEKAVAEHLLPDNALDWSLSQATNWIAARRHEIVRGIQAFVASELENIYAADLVMPLSAAQRELWAALKQGELKLRGVRFGEETEVEVRPADLRRLTLALHLMEDALISTITGEVVFVDPVIAREDVIKRWPSNPTPGEGKEKAARIKKDEHAKYKRLIAPHFAQYVKDMRTHPARPIPTASCDLSVVDEIAGRHISRRLAEEIRRAAVPPEWQKSGDPRRISFKQLAGLTPPIAISRAQID